MNKTMVITGGSNGLGESITRFFESKGNNIYIIDKDFRKSNTICNELNNVTSLNYNLNNYEDLKGIIDFFKNNNVKIDILINNAAIQYIETLEDLDIHHFEEVLRVNLISPVFLIKELLNNFNKNAQIINITSVHSSNPRENKFAYDASKAGLDLMTKEIALSLSKKNVRVNAVQIGATRTPMNNMFRDSETLENSIKKIPLGRVAETSDIINIIDYLIYKDTYSTGSIFKIDGGRSLFNG